LLLLLLLLLLLWRWWQQLEVGTRGGQTDAEGQRTVLVRLRKRSAPPPPPRVGMAQQLRWPW